MEKLLYTVDNIYSHECNLNLKCKRDIHKNGTPELKYVCSRDFFYGDKVQHPVFLSTLCSFGIDFQFISFIDLPTRGLQQETRANEQEAHQLCCYPEA